MFNDEIFDSDAAKSLLDLEPADSTDRLASGKEANFGEVTNAEKCLLEVEIKR